MTSRPSLFAGVGEAFVSAFGSDHEALIAVSIGDVRRVPCIFREIREGGFAEEEGAAVEGVTHRLTINAADDPGVEQDMAVTVVATGADTGDVFTVAGVRRDGRAMTRILLTAE